MLVEHVEPRSRDGAPDGRKLRPARGRSLEPVGGDHVRLRRSVVVVQLAGGQAPEEIDQRPGRAQLLARGDHLRELAGQLLVANLRRRLREALQRDERQEQPPDARLAQEAQQGERVAAAVVVDHHQRAAAGPGHEDLLERHVEAHRRELQRARRRREPLARAAPRDQVGDDAVRHHHALGHARGSRREQDVERIVGRGGARGDGRGKRVDGRAVAIEVDGARAEVGAALHHQGCRRIAKHRGEALGGIRGIERHDGRPRLHDGEQRHEHVGRARDAQSHRHAGPRAARAQVMGQPVGARLELGIGEHRGAVLDRGGGGRARDLRRHALQRVVRAARGGRVARGLRDELPPLRGREQRQAARRSRGIGERGGEQRAQLRGESADGGGIEEAGVVFDRAGERAAALLDRHGQVELGLGRRLLERADGEARQGHLLERPVLPHEEDLEERRVREAALGLQRFHDLVEGRVLVRLGFQRRLAHPPHHFREAGLALEVHAHHHGVGEESDERLQFRARAVGDGRADGDVALPARPREQDVERGQHHHEAGRAHLARPPAQRFGELRRDREALDSRAPRLLHAARPVDGQLEERRQAREALPPVVELGAKRAGVARVALPRRVVRVLQRGGFEPPRPGRARPARAARRPSTTRRSRCGGSTAGARGACRRRVSSAARSSGCVARSKGRAARLAMRPRTSSAARAGSMPERSMRENATGRSASTSCAGAPSTATKRVRSASWRAMTAFSAASRRAASSTPSISSATGTL